jgi:hypothetical protein
VERAGIEPATSGLQSTPGRSPLAAASADFAQRNGIQALGENGRSPLFATCAFQLLSNFLPDHSPWKMPGAASTWACVAREVGSSGNAEFGSDQLRAGRADDHST